MWKKWLFIGLHPVSKQRQFKTCKFLRGYFQLWVQLYDLWSHRCGWRSNDKNNTEVSAGHELNQIFAKPKFTILTKCWLRYLLLYFICWDQHTINYVCLNFTTQKTWPQYQLLFPLQLNFSKNSEFWFWFKSVTWHYFVFCFDLKWTNVRLLLSI